MSNNMTDKREDGGSVGPTGFIFYGTGWMQGGLTKREWFAGQALIGMNSNPELMEAMTKVKLIDGNHFDKLAENAYKQADAMLRAREGGEGV